MKPPLMSEISIRKATDDDGNACHEWLFDLNGHSFGGYCRTLPEARSEAERILELKIEDLSDEQAGECYKRLVGYNPLHEPSNLPGVPEVMTGEQVRALLWEMMKEKEAT